MNSSESNDIASKVSSSIKKKKGTRPTFFIFIYRKKKKEKKKKQNTTKREGGIEDINLTPHSRYVPFPAFRKQLAKHARKQQNCSCIISSRSWKSLYLCVHVIATNCCNRSDNVGKGKCNQCNLACTFLQHNIGILVPFGLFGVVTCNTVPWSGS